MPPRRRARRGLVKDHIAAQDDAIPNPAVIGLGAHQAESELDSAFRLRSVAEGEALHRGPGYQTKRFFAKASALKRGIDCFFAACRIGQSLSFA